MSEQGNVLAEALLQAIQAYHAHGTKEADLRLGRDDEALREWKVQRKEHLLEVKARARAYENQQDLTPTERQELGRRGHGLLKRRYGLYVLSGLVIIVASYPASLSAATILGAPITMVGDMKVVWPLWVWFSLLVLVAELLLVTSISRLLWHADVSANLETAQALDESERRQGKRMEIRDPAQQKRARLWLWGQIALATMLVLIDFAANVQFLLTESEASMGLSYFLAFAGFISFIGISVLLGRAKHQEDWIDSALRKKRDPKNRHFGGLANGGL